jgi:hypothetical protein
MEQGAGSIPTTANYKCSMNHETENFKEQIKEIIMTLPVVSRSNSFRFV